MKMLSTHQRLENRVTIGQDFGMDKSVLIQNDLTEEDNSEN